MAATLTDTQALQLEYWTAFNDIPGRTAGNCIQAPKATAADWMDFAIGRT